MHLPSLDKHLTLCEHRLDCVCVAGLAIHHTERSLGSYDAWRAFDNDEIVN